MLVGPGRGSAGGCLVAYLLGITSIDPVHYGLMFERFLDPSRMDNPDIDVDFPQSMRPGAKAYLEARYGHDHVCTIGTLSRSQPKQTLRDIGRAQGIDPADINAISRIIDQVDFVETEVDEGEEGPSWEEILDKKGGELGQWARTYPQLFRKLNEMVGMVRQSSRHASGVLVANKPILGAIPFRTRNGAPDAITQFDMYEVEELGGVKLDLLGLRHLDTLMYARQLIYERHGACLDFHSFGSNEYANSDIWPAISSGNTVGIFQLETPDLTRHAMQLKPQNEVDVAALISIVRPGVKDAGLGQIYLDRRSGKVPVEYDHPLMQSITKETYGVLVYQEQLMETSKKLAGFTGAEANSLRRALGKKKMADVLANKDKFLMGCMNNPQFLEGIGNNPVRALKAAETIWKSIEAAGRYAFNKSHAVGYALISTWEVWVKHYYPIEFIAALLATDGENINRYVREARRLHFNILPPDINLSGRKFTLGPVGSNEIRYGLQSIRGLGAVACNQIDAARPYKDFPDYLRRGGQKGADKTAAFNLIRIGAFDTMGPRADIMRQLEYHRATENLAPSTRENPDKLKAIVDRRLASGSYTIDVPDFSDPDVVHRIEQELVGNYITVDPMEPYLESINTHCISDPAQIAGYSRNAQFNIGGQITQIKPITVKKKGKYLGREMAFIVVQHNELDFDITVFPEVWADSRDLIKLGVPVIFRVVRDDRGCHLLDLERLDLLRSNSQ